MPKAETFNPGWRNDNQPIVNVSWIDAEEYCRWIGARLPSEAEWEYAARAGCERAIYGKLDDIAWYRDNSVASARDVGLLQANAYGLRDMLGNVWEWVNDWYGDKYNTSNTVSDPKGPSAGPKRVQRGGSWWNVAAECRFSRRRGEDPTYRDRSFGFRCAGELNWLF
jgi:formylglycine-generating enzyme required for sulfatase activity